MTRENKNNNLQNVVGHRFRPTTSSYDEQDVAFYALSIGASSDPIDAGDLQYTYELFSGGFNCFPTFAATFPLQTLQQIGSIPDQKLNLMEVLHGEHYLELFQPLPASGTVTNEATISQVYDKGSGALMIADITSTDQAGEQLAFNRASLFIRGRGNFGGDRGSSSQVDLPDREADEVFSERTNDNQALIYRLASGDLNPLHADTRFSALIGYERPILHGLCVYGYAARAVLKRFTGNNSERFKSINARFSHHVYPGETIETEMWHESATTVYFRGRVLERNEVVLSNGVLELHPE